MNILEMSDEELANLDPSTLGSGGEAASTEEVKEEETPAEGAAQGSAEEPADEGGQGSEASAEGQAEASQNEEGAEGQEQAAAQEGEQAPAKEAAESVQDVVDYKAQYEKLLTPFVANGKEMSVKNVDDAITLMQMGANYNKKMAALKPNLKLMKMLETSGLLSEEKISFLIDLEKKNPEAISKLIKDSNLDPMDLDAEKADGYKPTPRTVDDRELELDSVLEEIQDTPSYQRTLTVVSKEWDGDSKQVIANAPQLLKVINEHVRTGIYDLISSEVERERMLGRLNGLSDIAAYKQVGDAIQARGGFDHLNLTGKVQRQQTETKPVVVQLKPTQVDDEKLKDKRRAASPAKPAASSSAKATEFNPLAMSDEEFMKQVRPQYL